MVGGVLVNRKRRRRTVPEQLAVLHALGDRVRRAVATDMPVQAHHRVGRRHHHVQVVGNHQDAAAQCVADIRDQLVERDLAAKVHALHRLVEDQKVRLACDRTGQKRTLELAARQVAHLAVRQVGDPDAR